MMPFANNLNASYAKEEWTIWYRDTFDWEAPSTVDMHGKGLVKGLSELWARFLFETVQVNGQRGFSSFHLAWKHGAISIDGDWQGAVRLRNWLFGEKDHTDRGYVQEADASLLDKIAYAHARFIDDKQITHQIHGIAMIARDAKDFASQLEDLAKTQE